MTTRTHSRRSTPLYEEKRNSRNEVYYQPYYIGRPLGKGGFAHVFEVHTSQNTSSLALKKIAKADRQGKQDPLYSEKIRGEIRLMEMASKSSPNVVKYLHSFTDKDNFYILMQLCGLGSLSDILKRRKVLSEPEVRYYSRQMALTLIDLMKQNIIHRDIKLANFFVTADQQLRLGDFGLATFNNEEFRSKRSLCGTPNYISPEVIEKKQYSFPVDAWALGVSTFTMLLGVPPFETKNCKETYQRIKKCCFSFEGPYRHSRLSEQAKSFIREILIYEPGQRLTPQQMLVHPFLTHFPIPLYLEPQWAVSTPPQDFLKKYSLRLGKVQLSQNETILEKKRTRSGPLYRFFKEEAQIKEENHGAKVENVLCNEKESRFEEKAKDSKVKEERTKKGKTERLEDDTSKLQTSVSIRKRDGCGQEISPTTTKKRFRGNHYRLYRDEDGQFCDMTVNRQWPDSVEPPSIPLKPADKKLLFQMNCRLQFKGKDKFKSRSKDKKRGVNHSDGEPEITESITRGICLPQTDKDDLNQAVPLPFPPPQQGSNRVSSHHKNPHIDQPKTSHNPNILGYAQSQGLDLLCFPDDNYQLVFQNGCRIFIKPKLQYLVCSNRTQSRLVTLPIGQSLKAVTQMTLDLDSGTSALKDLLISWSNSKNNKIIAVKVGGNSKKQGGSH